MPVTAVFAILILLIVATPGLMLIGGVFSEGVFLAVAAAAIALVVLTVPAVEARRLAALLKPISLGALVPGAWMLVQVVPAPDWLAHPAWTSASAALGKPLAGTISLDIGATLLCLARFSLVLAFAVLAVAVALDRQRAQLLLFVLTAVATAVAAMLIALDLGALDFAGMDPAALREQMLVIAVIGLLLTCASLVRGSEDRTWRGATAASEGAPIIEFVAPGGAFVICLAAIVLDANAALLLAAACGVSILIGLAVIRRSRLGPWGRSGIAAAAAVGLIGFFAVNPANREVDPALSLSSQPRAAIATTQRALTDVKWIGTGAGTFEALVPFYRDVDDAVPRTAPTAAASVVIEMGRPFLWAAVVVILVGAGSFFRRALMRGRDYVYAGTGAACLVAVLLSSFANAGILGLAAALLTATVYGLALAQSRSWST